MGLFFKSRQATDTYSESALHQQKYNSARANLLIAIIFTAVNCGLALLGADTYFLFSCSVPYALITLGQLLCGVMFTPEEYLELGYTDQDFLPMELLYALIGIAVACLVVYVLCWILSKKHVAWMIVATVLFAIDTLFLVLYYGIAVDFVVDYIFHAWVMVILIRGVMGYFKAKKMEALEAEQVENFTIPVPVAATEATQEAVSEAVPEAETSEAVEQPEEQTEPAAEEQSTSEE